MKELRIQLSDRVFSKLQTNLGLKRMCGNFYGICDEITARIAQSIENDEAVLTLYASENDEEMK